MTSIVDSKLTRISVFYDGNFFAHVGTYYRYAHERKARITIAGLHAFIRHEVARLEGTEFHYARIVDAHYFRGRLSAHDITDPNRLFRERVFDDVLTREGVTTHFLPLTARGEKGVDVWFALEALEQTIHNRFDVVVLVASDSDYVPLVRKLNALGSRVMLLGWDFDFYDDESQSTRETRTAHALLEEVTYPVRMASVIEERGRAGDPIIDGLFMQQVPREGHGGTAMWAQIRADGTIEGGGDPMLSPAASIDPGADEEGTISALREGYGFISRSDGPDIYFYHEDLINCDFNDLTLGATVAFQAGTNPRGPCARLIRLLKR